MIDATDLLQMIIICLSANMVAMVQSLKSFYTKRGNRFQINQAESNWALGIARIQILLPKRERSFSVTGLRAEDFRFSEFWCSIKQRLIYI